MELLKRKIDHDLTEWKNKKDHLPLIVKGARQIGKTLSIRQFAQQNYKNVIEINFALQKQYKSIFDNGFEVDTILKNISLLNPSFTFTEGDTLFFFDELQDCANCATSLKPFHLDGRYDVICSGSLMGINYQQIESNSVGFKEDYEEDITKYAGGLDKGKIHNVFRKIPAFLGRDNKKFQISKVADGARGREYVGTVDWLDNAGMINRCYCMETPELPLKGNYNPDQFKLYFRDTGLLIGSLDEEAQEDLRANKNFNTYKGAIYENIVADMLVKQGYSLFYYKNVKGTVEMDFFVRDANSLIPVEVKAIDGATRSLNSLIEKEQYSDIRYGIKLGYKNIGFNGKFYTFPYFLTFFLKRFLKEKISLPGCM